MNRNGNREFSPGNSLWHGIHTKASPVSCRFCNENNKYRDAFVLTDLRDECSVLGPRTFEVDINILHPVSEGMNPTRVLLVRPAGFTDGIDAFMQIIEKIFR